MKLPQSRTGSRPAFTLIELLVVITIIAVLISLLLAGVFKAFSTARVVQTRNDISQLEAGIANFKQTMQVDYLPSNFPSAADPGYWNRLFTQAGPYSGPALQGNQCLVFFLSGGYGQGFSSDPTNPTAAAFTGETRKGAFFNFPSNRLPTIAPGSVFNDVYGVPFAYFSAYSGTGAPNSYNAGDNASLGLPGNPTPYSDQGGLALKPDSCQIISAGQNMVFGPGGVWPGLMTPQGMDDISNFATSQLGAGQ